MSFRPSALRLRRWLAVALLGLGGLVGAPVAATAQALAPTITAPANGASISSQSQLVAWTSVANVQAYYLYVGSSVGARDVVDSGSIHTTSYPAAGLPVGPTLYARVWAEVDGVWRYTDSTFSVAVLTPTIIFPAAGAVNASMSQPIRWTAVAGALAYYLYVGTAVGANNLINTGAITATSYSGAGLPGSQTLYARVWAQVGGVWRFTDSTFSAAPSASPFATITYPADGAVGANLSQPITWSTAAGAQSYYLYVGTTVGTNDLVNTGEVHQTSWLAGGLPSGRTLYVRVWTKIDNAWHYTDSTFSAAASAPLMASITYPANGATNAAMSQPIAWTTVANAQAYYLYVGTAIGTNNLINTGEVHQTSWLAVALPPAQTLYARVWTKLDGVWRYTDSTFTAAVQPAQVTYPANGATGVDMPVPIQWTTVPNVQAYYVYLGTTVGATDLVNSGQTLQTSYLAANLPTGRTLYLRLWTEVNGVWASVDSAFTAAAPPVLSATLAYPSDGASAIDQLLPASWDAVPAAQAYYLYVGTTVGARNVFDSKELHGTTSLAFSDGLPAAVTLYARLWTEVGGVWRYRDSTFTSAPIAPLFTAPHDGAVAVDAGQPFTWMSPGNASAHQLLIGTAPGAADLFDSGSINVASTPVPPLPAGLLYARAFSLAHGIWRHTDIAFTADASSPPSVIDTPVDGEPAFDTLLPFSWAAAPLGRGYRLRIGTTPGGSDVHDSGEISAPARFVPNLPLGPLFGRLETKIDGQWYPQDFAFTVAANTVSPAQQIKTALWATDLVRSMTPIDNRPYAWGGVFERIGGGYFANCVDYALTLLRVLQDVNSQLPARRLDVALNLDGHTLVEMLDPETQDWILLDPTFDATVRRAADGTLATAEDVSAATRAESWSDVSFQFLGAEDDFYARQYYLDYPLLFVDLYRDGQPQVIGQGGTVLPYLEPLSMPVSAAQVYVVGCVADHTAELLINGVVTTVDCSGVDGTSAVFAASSVAPTAQTSGSVTLYRPRRFVF